MFSTGSGTFPNDAVAVLAAILFVLLPLLLGLVAAIALRSRVRSAVARRGTGLLLIVGPLGLALFAVPRLDDWSFWDVLGVACALTAGAALGLSQRATDGLQGEARGWMRALGWLAFGLLLSEGLARVALPAAPSVPPPRLARLRVPVTNRDPPCNLIYASDDDVRARLSGPPGRSTVLHVGDSMVAGVGVGPGESFVDRLAAAQPGLRHVNLGASGAGPEAYALTLARFTERQPARLAIVYLFAGNDLADLNARFLCCSEGGLLRPESGRLVPRCAHARWNIPRSAHLATSPPPFVLRALAGVSRVAGHLLTLTVRAQQQAFQRGLGDVSGRNDPASRTPRWSFLGGVVRQVRDEARARRTPLLVVVLPSRPTIERSLGRTPVGNDYWVDLSRGEAGQRQIVATVREAGVDVLDAWDPVRAIAAREGVEATFARQYPGDVHLSALGHERFAPWLAEALGARGLTAETSPAR